MPEVGAIFTYTKAYIVQAMISSPPALLCTIASAALAIATLAVLPPTALAQKSYAIGLAGGATVPTGRFSDTESTGHNITGFLALGVPDLPVGVRFDGVYNRFSGRTVTASGGASTVENPDVRVIGILGNLIYTLPGTVAKPYIVTGGGIYNSKPLVAGAKSQNDFGFSAGFGATFGVSRLAAFIEARYHGVSRDDESGGNIQFVPITLGIMF